MNVGEIKVQNAPSLYLVMSTAKELLTAAPPEATWGYRALEKRLDFSGNIEPGERPEFLKQFLELKENFEMMIKTVTDPSESAEYYGRGKKLISAIEKDINEPPYELPRIYKLIKEFVQFNHELSRINVFDPPVAIFEEALEDARWKVARYEPQMPDKSMAERFSKQIGGIEATGRSAVQNRKNEAWKLANKQIKDLNDELNRYQPPFPIDVIMMETEKYVSNALNILHASIAEDEAKAKKAGRRSRLAGMEKELNAYIQEFNAIRWTDTGQFGRAKQLYFNVTKLEKQVKIEADRPGKD